MGKGDYLKGNPQKNEVAVLIVFWGLPLYEWTNGMGNDPFVDFPVQWADWALLALGYTQPFQNFPSHLGILSTVIFFDQTISVR